MNEEVEESKKSNDTIDINFKYLDAVPPIQFVKRRSEDVQFNLLLALMHLGWSEDDR